MSRNRGVAMAIVGLSIMGLIAGANASAADDAGAYLGVGFGRASNQVEEVGFDASDSAYKFFAGYEFSKYFATEFAYIDAGSPEQTIAAGAVQIHSTVLIASAVGQLPLGQGFTLFGKIGYAAYDTKSSLRAANESLQSKSSDAGLAFGSGTTFSFNRRFSVRAEYEVIVVSGGIFTMISASGAFKF